MVYEKTQIFNLRGKSLEDLQKIIEDVLRNNLNFSTTLENIDQSLKIIKFQNSKVDLLLEKGKVYVKVTSDFSEKLGKDFWNSVTKNFKSIFKVEKPEKIKKPKKVKPPKPVKVKQPSQPVVSAPQPTPAPAPQPTYQQPTPAPAPQPTYQQPTPAPAPQPTYQQTAQTPLTQDPNQLTKLNEELYKIQEMIRRIDAAFSNQQISQDEYLKKKNFLSRKMGEVQAKISLLSG